MGAENVLVGDGHASQRARLAALAALVGDASLSERLFGGDGDEGIQSWIELFDPFQKGVGQFLAAELTSGEAGAKLSDGFIVHGGGIRGVR